MTSQAIFDDLNIRAFFDFATEFAADVGMRALRLCFYKKVIATRKHRYADLVARLDAEAGIFECRPGVICSPALVWIRRSGENTIVVGTREGLRASGP